MSEEDAAFVSEVLTSQGHCGTASSSFQDWPATAGRAVSVSQLLGCSAIAVT